MSYVINGYLFDKCVSRLCDHKSPYKNASSMFHSIILERGWQTKTVMCINSAFVILDIYRSSTRRILIPLIQMCIRVK